MEIVDVIYGKFSIPTDVAAIVTTPQFQRLKSIKQLGLLKIDNCIEEEHHRYAHCLGTYFAATLMLDTLERNTEWLRNNNNRIPLVYRKSVQIAALLHDIAHGPFSHAWEHVVNDYIHEQQAAASIDQIFKQINDEQFPELRHNNNYGIELIKALIEGDINNFKLKNNILARYKFIFEIVSNKSAKLDVDKWDYLKRDAYYLKHLCQPNVDFDDVFLRARVSDCGSHIEYRYEDYDKIFNLFAARYEFHVNAYSLPEYLLKDFILNLAVEEIQPKINNILVTNITAHNISEFLQLTDRYILKLIERSVLSKFLQNETEFQEVEQLEKVTVSAPVKVSSVSKYMPTDEDIRFYGNIKNKPILNDHTKLVKKVYCCYCDQSTQKIYYTIKYI